MFFWLYSQIPDGENAIRSLSISADGSKVCAANNLGKCFIWNLGEKDTSTFDPLTKIDVCNTYILKAMFSPDGKWVVARSWVRSPSSPFFLSKSYTNVLFFWDYFVSCFYWIHHSKTTVQIFVPSHSDATRWLAASCADNTTKLYSVQKEFALVKTLVGHTRWVWDCKNFLRIFHDIFTNFLNFLQLSYCTNDFHHFWPCVRKIPWKFWPSQVCFLLGQTTLWQLLPTAPQNYGISPRVTPSETTAVTVNLSRVSHWMTRHKIRHLFLVFSWNLSEILVSYRDPKLWNRF